VKQLILEVYGPFKVPCKKQRFGSSKRIERDLIKDFWNELKGQHLPAKQGCYVFALRSGKGYSPWYVGKTARSMEKECFAFHKLEIYNKALFEGIKGTPVLFFITQPGSKIKMSKAIIRDLEPFLIQSAKSQNPNLLNTQQTKNLPKWGIKGVIRGGMGKPSAGSRQLKKMMGL
jgi:hypothetical protein